MYTPGDRPRNPDDDDQESEENELDSPQHPAEFPPWYDSGYQEPIKLFDPVDDDRRWAIEREWFDAMDLQIARPKAEAVARLLGSTIALTEKLKAMKAWRYWANEFCAAKIVDGFRWSGMDGTGSPSDTWLRQQPEYRQYQRELLQAQRKRDNAKRDPKKVAKASKKTSARRWLTRKTEKLQNNPSPGLLAEAKKRLRILGLSLEEWLKSCQK